MNSGISSNERPEGRLESKVRGDDTQGRIRIGVDYGSRAKVRSELRPGPLFDHLFYLSSDEGVQMTDLASKREIEIVYSLSGPVPNF